MLLHSGVGCCINTKSFCTLWRNVCFGMRWFSLHCQCFLYICIHGRPNNFNVLCFDIWAQIGIGQCQKRGGNAHVVSHCRQAALLTLRRFTTAHFLYYFIPFSRYLCDFLKKTTLVIGLAGGGTRLGCLTNPVFPVHGYAFSTQKIRYSDLSIHLGCDLVPAKKQCFPVLLLIERSQWMSSSFWVSTVWNVNNGSLGCSLNVFVFFI